MSRCGNGDFNQADVPVTDSSLSDLIESSQNFIALTHIMKLCNFAQLASMLCVLVIQPASESPINSNGPVTDLERRQSTPITAWSITIFPSGCADQSVQHHMQGMESGSCIVDGGRGISIDTQTTSVTTWSGNNCQGSSQSGFFERECNDILFGSVSISG